MSLFHCTLCQSFLKYHFNFIQIDPTGYQNHIEKKEREFHQELKKQINSMIK